MDDASFRTARPIDTVVELDPAFLADPYALYARLRAETRSRGRGPGGSPGLAGDPLPRRPTGAQRRTARQGRDGVRPRWSAIPCHPRVGPCSPRS